MLLAQHLNVIPTYVLVMIIIAFAYNTIDTEMLKKKKRKDTHVHEVNLISIFFLYNVFIKNNKQTQDMFVNFFATKRHLLRKYVTNTHTHTRPETCKTTNKFNSISFIYMHTCTYIMHSSFQPDGFPIIISYIWHSFTFRSTSKYLLYLSLKSYISLCHYIVYSPLIVENLRFSHFKRLTFIYKVYNESVIFNICLLKVISHLWLERYVGNITLICKVF